ELCQVARGDLDAMYDCPQGHEPPVQPVEQPHAVAALEQPLGEDAADVAGPAGHEDQLSGLGGFGAEAVAAAGERGQLPPRRAVLAHAGDSNRVRLKVWATNVPIGRLLPPPSGPAAPAHRA